MFSQKPGATISPTNRARLSH